MWWMIALQCAVSKLTLLVFCVPRLSFSEGRREPGNIGGVKPLTSGASSFV